MPAHVAKLCPCGLRLPAQLSQHSKVHEQEVRANQLCKSQVQLAVRKSNKTAENGKPFCQTYPHLKKESVEVMNIKILGNGICVCQYEFTLQSDATEIDLRESCAFLFERRKTGNTGSHLLSLMLQ